MKAFLVPLILVFTCGSAFAGTNAKAIYKVLKVKEVNVNPGIAGSYKLEKEIGNLVCHESGAIVPNAKPSFSCSLGQNNNGKAIYQALAVKEINVNPGIAGSSKFEKSIGGLVCSKSLIIYPGAKPDYLCSLN